MLRIRIAADNAGNRAAAFDGTVLALGEIAGGLAIQLHQHKTLGMTPAVAAGVTDRAWMLEEIAMLPNGCITRVCLVAEDTTGLRGRR